MIKSVKNTAWKILLCMMSALLTSFVFLQIRTVEAEASSESVKYAVSIFGIEQAIDEDGNTMGLTFGPALGADYTNSYKSHTPSGVTSEGHDHRCLHNDDWDTIILWNNTDPYVYEDCIGQGCTHSVELNLSYILKNQEFEVTYTGDGPSVLSEELWCDGKGNIHRFMNITWSFIDVGADYGNGNDGWGSSRIRAVLNGADSLTMRKGSYNYYNGYGDDYITIAAEDYTSSNALIAAFPVNLQAAIGKQAIKYDSVHNEKTIENLKTSYDKLWLFSPNELGDYVSDEQTNHPLELTTPNKPYSKFVGAGDVSNANVKRIGYGKNLNVNTNSRATQFWLRSLETLDSYGDAPAIRSMHWNGAAHRHDEFSYSQGVAFGFSLSKPQNQSSSISLPLLKRLLQNGTSTIPEMTFTFNFEQLSEWNGVQYVSTGAPIADKTVTINSASDILTSDPYVGDLTGKRLYEGKVNNVLENYDPPAVGTYAYRVSEVTTSPIADVTYTKSEFIMLVTVEDDNGTKKVTEVKNILYKDSSGNTRADYTNPPRIFEDKQELIFYNTYGSNGVTTPTGIMTNILPFIVIGGAGVGGLTLYVMLNVRRKRKENS